MKQSPYNWVVSHPLYTAINQGPLVSCSFCWLLTIWYGFWYVPHGRPLRFEEKFFPRQRQSISGRNSIEGGAFPASSHIQKTYKWLMMLVLHREKQCSHCSWTADCQRNLHAKKVLLSRRSLDLKQDEFHDEKCFMGTRLCCCCCC